MATSALTRRARPARLRITLADDPAGSVPLTLPAQKTWPAAIVCGVFFAIFAGIEVSTITKMIGQETRTVFDIAGLLFQGFWVLGWSVGVLFLLGLTVLFAFHRETARITGDRLIHAPRLGPLRFMSEYELAEIRNLRVDDGKGPEFGRIRFDYGAGATALGNDMPRAVAERQVRTIQTAIDALGAAPATELALPVRRSGGRPGQVRRDGQGTRVTLDEEDRPALSAIVLVLANLVPIGGVLLLGWDLGEIMVLFWAENAVIGVYNVLKLAVVARWGALFVGPFFLGHYGGFMAAHFLFVYYLFVRGIAATGPEPAAFTALSSLFVPLWPALLSLVVSHGISFFSNFLKGREYVGRSVNQQMTEPYRRVILLHLTIIFGGWAIMLLRQPVAGLVVLVALKTFIDLKAHRREHKPRTGEPRAFFKQFASSRR